MRAILFFSFSVFLILTGCVKQSEIQPVKYIKSSCPKLRILPRNFKEPKDFKLKIIEENGYYKVKKEDLKQASLICQKKSLLIKRQQKYIKFYENQIKKYNAYIKR